MPIVALLVRIGRQTADITRVYHGRVAKVVGLHLHYGKQKRLDMIKTATATEAQSQERIRTMEGYSEAKSNVAMGIL